MKPSTRSPRPLTPASDGPPTGPAFLLLAGLLALLPVLFWRGALGPFEPVKLVLVQLTALALIAVWPGPPAFRPRVPLDLAVLAGCASALLSTAASVSPRTSWQGAWESHAGLGTLLPLAVIYFAARTVSRGPGSARALLSAITVGALPAFGYAAIQTAGADPLNWSDLSPWHGWSRPASTLGHPNHLGALAALCVPPLLALAHADGPRRNRALLGAALALALFTVVATLSRAAWLAATVGGTAWLVVTVRPRNTWLVAGLIALVAGAAVSWQGPLGERVRRVADASPRLLVWQAAWDSFRDRPLLGHGVDTFAIAFAQHRPPAYAELEWGVTPNRAHNELLHVLTTQGALGAAAFLFLLFALAHVAWQAFRSRPADRPLIAAAGASLLGWATLGVFGFSVVTTATVAAALAGVLAGLAHPNLAEGQPPPATPRVIAAAAGLGWLAMLANLLLDAHTGRSSATLILLLLHAALIGLGLFATWHHLVPIDTTRPRTISPRIIHWPAAAGATILAAVFVLRPLIADCACQWGERQPAGPEPPPLTAHQRAARLAPGQPVYHVKLAARAQEAALAAADDPSAAGHRRLATSALRTAVALAPADPDLWANLARALHAQALAGEAEPREVAEAHAQALRRDPHNLILLAEAARSAVRLGLLDRGRELAARGLALAPRLAPLHVEQANLALAAADLDAAERHLNDALAGEWRGDAESIDRCWGLLGYVLAERGDHARAAALAAFVLQRRPDWVTVRCLRAQSLERLGQSAAARSEYEQALRTAPTFAPALQGRDRLAHR